MPTVTYGAVMTHDTRTGAMTGFAYGSATGGEHAGHVNPGASPAPASDSAEVVGTVARYHDALVRADSSAALAMITSDAVILESGRSETREQYRAHHLAADMAFATAVQTRRAVTSVVVRGDVAWVASQSTSQGQFRGRQIDATGAELMVLTRTSGGWRISAIHWSSR